MDTATEDPWDWIYATRDLSTLGWYERDPRVSLELVNAAVATGRRSLIDVGGGASWLVDRLLELPLDRVAVLDISPAGLAIPRHRLASRAADIDWIVGDLRTAESVGQFEIWHDRATFHFLLDEAERRNYVRLAERTVRIGGLAIIATFAADGPERCSGMPVLRWDPDDLAREFGDGFRLTASRRHVHHTPAGIEQRFQYSVLERVDPIEQRLA